MIPNLSKGMIDDMQQLRKRMRSEFGVELRLSQSDILERITELAERSKDQRTRTLYDHLKGQISGDITMHQKEADQAVDAPRHKLRVYRGQTILEEVNTGLHSPKTERVYRGQTVN